MPTESALTNELSALMVGRIPVWCMQTVTDNGADDFTPLPSASSDGVPLLNSPRTLVMLQTRRKHGKKFGYVRVITPDVTATYTLVIAGESIVYNAGAAAATSEAQIYAGLLAAASANVVLEPDYTFALRYNNAGSPVGLYWEGPSAGVFTSVAATGGGVLAGYSECSDFGYQVFATAILKRGSGPDTSQWFPVGPPVASYATDAVRRFDTAGLERLYVQVTDIVPDASAGAGILPYWYVFVGPSSNEDILGSI